MRRHYDIREAAAAILERNRITAQARIDFTLDEWARCRRWFRQRCAVCGFQSTPATRLTRDHWIPTNAGGSQHADNIVPLCADCNNSKGDFDPVAWLELRKPHVAKRAQERVAAYFAYVEREDG